MENNINENKKQENITFKQFKNEIIKNTQTKYKKNEIHNTYLCMIVPALIGCISSISVLFETLGNALIMVCKNNNIIKKISIKLFHSFVNIIEVVIGIKLYIKSFFDENSIKMIKESKTNLCNKLCNFGNKIEEIIIENCKDEINTKYNEFQNIDNTGNTN
jgi:hypothetical protein